MGDPQHADAGDPRHRHQRQGLDGADDHPPADGARADGRHVHQPAPRADQRAPHAQRRADQRRRLRRADRRRSPTSRCSPACARPTSRAVTAAAFRWFADIAVDVAVVEVGLLGRWDATNVVDAQVAVVTNIGLDHTEFAGPTLADIAREKAGIIKPAQRGRDRGDRPRAGRHLRAAEGGAATSCAASDFETLDNSLAVGGRLARPAHADDDLPRRLPAAARRPPGRQRGGGAHRGRGVLRRPARRPTSSTRASPTSTMPGRFEVIGVQPLVDRRRRPQPAGRRRVRAGVLRRLPTRRAADPRHRHAARPGRDARRAACRRVRRGASPAPPRRRAACRVGDVAGAARELGCDEVYLPTPSKRACAAAMRTPTPTTRSSRPARSTSSATPGRRCSASHELTRRRRLGR